MHILNDETYDDLVDIADRTEQVFQAATHLASLGLRLFPAKPFDQVKLETALAAYAQDKIDAKAEKRPQKMKQRDYQMWGGKAPAFANQYEKASYAQGEIDSWWNPTSGKYRGCNICLATGEGSGVIVLDLDVKLDNEGNVLEDGFVWFNEISAKHPAINTFKVRTGGSSGRGMHLYFRWRDDIPAKSNKNKFEAGVDFRADNGHVMAPFSKCYSMYDAIELEPVADMPDWLFNAIFNRDDKKENAKAATTGATSEGPSFALTPLDQIVDMLDCIDPAEHEDWWQDICFAIKSEHDSDDGYSVLDQWSARDPDQYDAAMNLDFWNRGTAKKAGGANISTLYYFAEQCGWINPKRGTTKLDVTKAVRMMNRSFAIIDNDRWMTDLMKRGKTADRRTLPPTVIPPMTLFKTRYALTDDGKVRHSYARVTEVNVAQVNMMAAGYQVEMQLPNGKIVMKDLYDVWLRNPARMSYVSAGYYIENARCPQGVINMFPGFKVRPKEGTPTMFLRHLKEIVCSGDEERALWIMNRLAYMIQFGDTIIPTALAITGDQGSGKSMLGEYVGEVLGELNYKYLHDGDALASRFSEEMVGKFLIVADEAIFSGDPKLRNKLKSLISSKTLRDEGKGKAAKEAQNVMFLIALSNEEEPIAVERGDRRWTVMKTDNKFSKINRDADKEVDKEARQYFKQLAAEMRGEGPANLLHMLLNWDVDIEMARSALATKEKAAMADTRMMRCDSLVAYLYFRMVDGFEQEVVDDGNESGEGYGGRSRMGTFYTEYTDWVSKNRQRNSEWRADSIQVFRSRMLGEFGCSIIKPKNKSTLVWPTYEEMRNHLRVHIPDLIDIIEAEISAEYNAEQETEF
jgi:Bifunctional DNA primase/polymerase, N-terminal/Family of unknown function (DUF5906)/Primase C terminal 2 (PriCT-2)